MTIRKKIKRLLQVGLPSKYPPILVASFGRAGSTLVFDALSEGMARARFGRATGYRGKIVRDFAWDLSAARLSHGVVYKTHDYPSALIKSPYVKSIFLFGSMVESALSVYALREKWGDAWVARHFDHLKSSDNVDNLLTRDALGFMEQVRRWAAHSASPVLCIRYEALWDNSDKITEFVGYRVELPVRKQRREKHLNQEIISMARTVYGPLDARLALLPDCFVANEKLALILEPATM